MPGVGFYSALTGAGLAWLAILPAADAGRHPTHAAVVMSQSNDTFSLPAPRLDSDFSVERALRERRSVREFARAALTPAEISQLLWAAQGMTSRDGLRTAPSAGALYPLELYLVVGAVQGLEAGIYNYVPDGHRLVRKVSGEHRRELAAAALGQECVADAAVVLVFASVERRTTRKYGSRGARYIHIEVGHAAQNVLLQATALGLGAVVVGAFDDAKVAALLNLPAGEAPLYLVPLGRR